MYSRRTGTEYIWFGILSRPTYKDYFLARGYEDCASAFRGPCHKGKLGCTGLYLWWLGAGVVDPPSYWLPIYDLDIHEPWRD